MSKYSVNSSLKFPIKGVSLLLKGSRHPPPHTPFYKSFWQLQAAGEECLLLSSFLVVPIELKAEERSLHAGFRQQASVLRATLVSTDGVTCG